METLLVQAKYQEAEKEGYALLRDAEGAFGKEHPLSREALQVYCEIPLNFHMFGGAEAVKEADLLERERLLGEGHPTVMLLELRLAERMEKAGKHGEAERLAIRAIEGLEAKSGLILDKTFLLEAKCGLVEMLAGAGRQREARRVLEEVRGEYEQLYGPNYRLAEKIEELHVRMKGHL